MDSGALGTTDRSRPSRRPPDRRRCLRRTARPSTQASGSPNGLSCVPSGLADPETFTQAIRRELRPQLVDIVGEIDWTPHALRHTFATRLLSQNVAPQTVSGLLGHDSTAFAFARYSHWVDSDLPLLTSQVTSALGA